MVTPPTYPYVLYPHTLSKALEACPRREVFLEQPPYREDFDTSTSAGKRMLSGFFRMVGMPVRAARVTLPEQEAAQQAYEEAIKVHEEKRAAFTLEQDARFTDAALRDYRRPSVRNILDVSIREASRNSFVDTGVAEYSFYRQLTYYFGDRIYRRFVVRLKEKEYHPDFTFFDPATRLRIDIELDEPYGLRDRLAIHFIDLSEVKGRYVAVDEERDEAFLDGKWIVARFAESQTVTNPSGCCRVVADVVSRITGEVFPALAETMPVEPVPRWTREQANVWSENDYRRPFLEQAEREVKQPVATVSRTFTPSSYQQAIFDFLRDGSGHGLVTAVAGSGKSTTLLEATKIIREGNMKARILLLAFNRSIRNELEAKVRASGISGVDVATLNSFGKRVVERTLGKTEIDVHKYQGMLSRAATELGIQLSSQQKRGKQKGDRDYAVKLVNLCRSYTTVDANDLVQLTELGERYSVPAQRTKALQPIVVRALELGEEQAIAFQRTDFDDQCYLPVRFNFPVTPYDFVFVDECQDLTQTQLELVRRAAGDRGRLLFVGDPRQAIMGFRGADNDSINNIKKLPEPPTELDLTVCYRCPTTHIELAQTLMPTITAAPNATSGTVHHLEWKDIAVHAREGDLMFARKNNLVQRAVLDLIAGGHTINYVPVSAKATDDPESNVGAVVAVIKHLRAAARQRYGTNAPKPKQKEGDVEDPKILWVLSCLHQAAARWGGDFLDFVEHRTNPDPHTGVTVCTAHQAKGLEAERVFILGESDFGASRPEQPAWEIEQELNLKYVAYTRSKNILYRVHTSA